MGENNYWCKLHLKIKFLYIIIMTNYYFKINVLNISIDKLSDFNYKINELSETITNNGFSSFNTFDYDENYNNKYIKNINIYIKASNIKYNNELLLKECPICLNTLFYDIKTLNCKHDFCNKCYNKWKIISPQCPLCRQSC